jgi:hypothetical protein
MNATRESGRGYDGGWGVTMTKVAILSTVWLHLVVLGLLVAGTELYRIERLPVPAIREAAAAAPLT